MKQIKCIMLNASDYSRGQLKKTAFEKTLTADVLLLDDHVIKNRHWRTTTSRDIEPLAMTVKEVFRQKRTSN